MQENFRKAIKEANMALTMKLNKISVYSLLPVALMFGFKLFQYPIVTLISIIYLGFITLMVFSRFSVSVKLKNLFVKEDNEENRKRLDDVIDFFEKKNFFNRILKKEHEKIVGHLNTASVELNQMLKKERKERANAQ